MDDVISASKVRKLIKEGRLADIMNIVPSSTWEFLNTTQGKEIMEKIRLCDSPH